MKQSEMDEANEVRMIASEIAEVLYKVLSKHRASRPVGYAATSMVYVAMMFSEGKSKEEAQHIIGEIWETLHPSWQDFNEDQRAGHA